MGSPCELLIESSSEGIARDLANVAATEAWRIEDKFSRYLPGNIVDQINSSCRKTIGIDAETAQLLAFADTLYELSEGRFDITSGVLREVWHFDGGSAVPTQLEIDAVLPRVAWSRVIWTEQSVRLPIDGMEIDFGGFGKEYAVDQVVALLRQLGSEPCLINFGGDLAVTGAPSNTASWRVGIESASSADKKTVIALKQGALATSGDGHRFLQKEGVRYSHVLDPTTGWPVKNAPASVTVAADTCTQAGMLSTLAMLSGAKADKFISKQAEQYWIRWPEKLAK